VSLCTNFPTVKRYIKTLRGGSHPVLAEASDGQLYVVKFRNNLQGPSLLFNEAMGSELYRAFALPVPEWKPLKVTDSFIDQNPGLWLETAEGRMRPESGLCFGSLFLGSDAVRLLEILPGSSFRKIGNLRDFWLAWLVDVCAGHLDNRQAIYTEELGGRLTAFFVDHGHMFNGPNSNESSRFQAARYLDWRVYQPVPPQSMTDLPALELQRITGNLQADLLWHEIKKLPEAWINFKAVQQFAKCLDNLSKSELLRSIHETLVDAIWREQAVATTSEFRGRRIQPASDTFSGIQIRQMVARAV